MALSKISRCRVDYDGPSIPIPSPVREMDQETKVTKDPVLPSDDGSAKYVQPTVVQKPKLTIAPKSSKIDPNLSRFTVKSLSSKRTELRAVTEKNNLPNLHVHQEQKLETITEVVEIASSKSTPLVPPPAFIPCVGCGEPLFGLPCRWCTCVQCGNDIRDGSCLFCGSRNSFAYDPNQNSFYDSPNFSNYPSHSYEQESYYPNHNDASYHDTPTISCEYCGGPHQGFDCQNMEFHCLYHNPYTCGLANSLESKKEKTMVN